MEGLSIPGLLVWYVVFLFSTTFHEFMHAFAADRMGDQTAASGGQLTLDPIPHLRRSTFGMLVWPVLSFFFSQGRWMFGWASAPYDRNWALNFPRRYALMSLAGPLANFILVAVGVLTIRALVSQGAVQLAMPPEPHSLIVPVDHAPAMAALSMALSVLVTLNVVLGVFNLIPVPPLDGFGVIEGLAPRGHSTFFDVVRMTPAYQFLGMVLAWRFGDVLIEPALNLTLLALYVR